MSFGFVCVHYWNLLTCRTVQKNQTCWRNINCLWKGNNVLKYITKHLKRLKTMKIIDLWYAIERLILYEELYVKIRLTKTTNLSCFCRTLYRFSVNFIELWFYKSKGWYRLRSVIYNDFSKVLEFQIYKN